MTSLSETFSHVATECMEVGAMHVNSDGFKKAPLPLRRRGFAQSASELSCVPLKRRNGNAPAPKASGWPRAKPEPRSGRKSPRGAILEASEFDCAEGGGK